MSEWRFMAKWNNNQANKREEIVDGKMKCYKNAWRTMANTMNKKKLRAKMKKKCLKKKMPEKNPICTDAKRLVFSLCLVERKREL